MVARLVQLQQWVLELKLEIQAIKTKLTYYQQVVSNNNKVNCLMVNTEEVHTIATLLIRVLLWARASTKL